jgi:hypothetical protein
MRTPVVAVGDCPDRLLPLPRNTASPSWALSRGERVFERQLPVLTRGLAAAFWHSQFYYPPTFQSLPSKLSSIFSEQTNNESESYIEFDSPRCTSCESVPAQPPVLIFRYLDK